MAALGRRALGASFGGEGRARRFAWVVGFVAEVDGWEAVNLWEMEGVGKRSRARGWECWTSCWVESRAGWWGRVVGGVGSDGGFVSREGWG